MQVYGTTEESGDREIGVDRMSEKQTPIIKVKLIQTDLNRFEWLITKIEGFPTKQETEDAGWWEANGKYIYMETIDGRNVLTVFEGFKPNRMDNVLFVLEEGKTSSLGGDAKQISGSVVLQPYFDMIQERVLLWNSFTRNRNDVIEEVETGREREYVFGDAHKDVWDIDLTNNCDRTRIENVKKHIDDMNKACDEEFIHNALLDIEREKKMRRRIANARVRAYALIKRFLGNENER